MQFLNIAGYQFASLQNLSSLRDTILHECQLRNLKGTVLLSHEGINISLAGELMPIELFITYLEKMNLFSPIRFHRTYSTILPFHQLKIKLKKEIITFRHLACNPTSQLKAPRVSPAQLKQWLDEKREMMLIDTRNDCEIELGTFKGAHSLNLKRFTEFPNKIAHLKHKQQETVLFCTGGIRCEKAGLYMQSQGFTQVYQLDGGILGYFAAVGGEHYQGKCFVFDDRLSVNPDLSC